MASPWKFARHGQSGLGWRVVPLLGGARRQAVRPQRHATRAHSRPGHPEAPHGDHRSAPSVARLVGTVRPGHGKPYLPGFISICPPLDHGGVRNYGYAFLPAIFQGTAIGQRRHSRSRAAIRQLVNGRQVAALQRQQLDLLQAMNAEHIGRTGGDDRMEGVIKSFELAFRMQAAVPRLTDLGNETTATQSLYGIGEEPTDDFGRRCLLARRFAEAGVRFVQVSHSFKWDQHHSLKNGPRTQRPRGGSADRRAAPRPRSARPAGRHARPVGRGVRPNARHGGQGRPRSQSPRLHDVAGGRRRPGRAWFTAPTDEFGYHAVENKVHMHDLHATILHLLGLDHERLTYRHAGRDFRLTDVHGRVVHDILA